MPYTNSKAQAGRGSTISIGTTPTLIGEVTDFPLTRGKWEFADVTNLQSGSDSEMIPTIRKGATITFKGNRVSLDAGQALVEAAYASGALQTFTVALPKEAGQSTTADTCTFSAYVAGSSFTISPTKQIEFSIDLQVSGAMPITEGA